MESARVADQLLREFEPAGRGDGFSDLILSVDDHAPLIEPGEYEGVLLGAKIEKRFTRDLIACRFRIVTQGDAFGLTLPGYFNHVADRNRRSKVAPLSKLGRWIRLLHQFAPTEVSEKRIQLKVLARFWYLVRVETCTGHRDRPLPATEQYSQVREILAVVGRIKGASA